MKTILGLVLSSIVCFVPLGFLYWAYGDAVYSIIKTIINLL